MLSWSNTVSRVEILAPCGSFEALYAAIHYGANAVYCGGKNFGARAYSSNFNHEEMKEVVRYAHHHDVKVYVTMNTLLYEDEFDDVKNDVDYYYSIDVDALIIQDLGLLSYVLKTYPDFEVHASTQMHVHNKKGILFLKELGVKRIVLPRETPIEKIREYCQLNIEIETFSYGALCISYSGQCLMSSVTQQRSGNKGMCAQSCRMKYELIRQKDNSVIASEGNYLLSPKDLNTLNNVHELIEAGVSSLKIEGRMKKAEYVGKVVSEFVKATSCYYDNKQYTCSKDSEKELKSVFNREFTAGRVFHAQGKELMNYFRPNHVGTPLGKIIKATKDNIIIQLSDDLNQFDGIRILQENDVGFIVNFIKVKGKLVRSAKKGEQVEIPCTQYVSIGSMVLKTSDTLLNQRLLNDTSKPFKTVSLTCEVSAKIGKPFIIQLSDGKHQVMVSSDEMCQKALNQPMSKERIIEQISKFNDPLFTLKQCDIDMDDIYFSIKEINALRRSCLQQLIEKRQLFHHRTTKKEQFFPLKEIPLTSTTIVEIMKKEQIIESDNILLCSSSALLCKQNDIMYASSTFTDDMATQATIVNDLGGLYQHKDFIAGHGLNCTNSYCLAFLYEHGATNVIFSVEMDKNSIEKTCNAFEKRYGFMPNTTTYVYGRRNLMISDYCVVNSLLSDGSKENCSLCIQENYALKDGFNNTYPLRRDDHCHSIILEHKPFSSLDKTISTNKYIRLTIEDEKEAKKVIKRWFYD